MECCPPPDEPHNSSSITCRPPGANTRTLATPRHVPAGYVAERERLIHLLSSTPASASAVVYGGDSHNAWAGDRLSCELKKEL